MGFRSKTVEVEEYYWVNLFGDNIYGLVKLGGPKRKSTKWVTKYAKNTLQNFLKNKSKGYKGGDLLKDSILQRSRVHDHPYVTKHTSLGKTQEVKVYTTSSDSIKSYLYTIYPKATNISYKIIHEGSTEDINYEFLNVLYSQMKSNIIDSDLPSTLPNTFMYKDNALYIPFNSFSNSSTTNKYLYTFVSKSDITLPKEVGKVFEGVCKDKVVNPLDKVENALDKLTSNLDKLANDIDKVKSSVEKIVDKNSINRVTYSAIEEFIYSEDILKLSLFEHMLKTKTKENTSYFIPTTNQAVITTEAPYVYPFGGNSPVVNSLDIVSMDKNSITIKANVKYKLAYYYVKDDGSNVALFDNNEEAITEDIEFTKDITHKVIKLDNSLFSKEPLDTLKVSDDKKSIDISIEYLNTTGDDIYRYILALIKNHSIDKFSNEYIVDKVFDPYSCENKIEYKYELVCGYHNVNNINLFLTGKSINMNSSPTLDLDDFSSLKQSYTLTNKKDIDTPLAIPFDFAILKSGSSDEISNALNSYTDTVEVRNKIVSSEYNVLISGNENISDIEIELKIYQRELLQNIQNRIKKIEGSKVFYTFNNNSLSMFLISKEGLTHGASSSLKNNTIHYSTEFPLKGFSRPWVGMEKRRIELAEDTNGYRKKSFGNPKRRSKLYEEPAWLVNQFGQVEITHALVSQFLEFSGFYDYSRRQSIHWARYLNAIINFFARYVPFSDDIQSAKTHYLNYPGTSFVSSGGTYAIKGFISNTPIYGLPKNPMSIRVFGGSSTFKVGIPLNLFTPKEKNNDEYNGPILGWKPKPVDPKDIYTIYVRNANNVEITTNDEYYICYHTIDKKNNCYYLKGFSLSAMVGHPYKKDTSLLNSLYTEDINVISDSDLIQALRYGASKWLKSTLRYRYQSTYFKYITSETIVDEYGKPVTSENELFKDTIKYYYTNRKYTLARVDINTILDTIPDATAGSEFTGSYSAGSTVGMLMPISLWRGVPLSAKDHVVEGTLWIRYRVYYTYKKKGWWKKFTGFLKASFKFPVSLIIKPLDFKGHWKKFTNVLTTFMELLGKSLLQIIMAIVTVVVTVFSFGTATPLITGVWALVLTISLIVINVAVNIVTIKDVKKTQKLLASNQEKINKMKSEIEQMIEDMDELLLDIVESITYDQGDEIDEYYDAIAGEKAYGVYDTISSSIAPDPYASIERLSMTSPKGRGKAMKKTR